MSGNNTNAEFQCILNMALTLHTQQPLDKHRAQPPFRNQQQPLQTTKAHWYHFHRIPFKTKPRMTRENVLQLRQAGLKPVQERGLSDQRIDKSGVVVTPGGMSVDTWRRLRLHAIGARGGGVTHGLLCVRVCRTGR